MAIMDLFFPPKPVVRPTGGAAVGETKRAATAARPVVDEAAQVAAIRADRK